MSSESQAADQQDCRRARIPVTPEFDGDAIGLGLRHATLLRRLPECAVITALTKKCPSESASQFSQFMTSHLLYEVLESG